MPGGGSLPTKTGGEYAGGEYAGGGEYAYHRDSALVSCEYQTLICFVTAPFFL